MIMEQGQKKLKKMQTKELTIGMYVHDVGRSWLTHPWRTKKKLITSKDDIRTLLEHGINEVVVDLGRGVNSREAGHVEFGIDGATVKEARTMTPQDVLGHVMPASKVPPQTPRIEQVERRKKPRPEKPADSVTLEEEFPRARQTYLKALEVTRDFIADARAGKTIAVEKVTESLHNMIDSVFRNRDALLAILKLRNYDEYTFTHSLNVSTLSVCIGRQLNYSRDQLMVLGMGGVFHDVGKTGIPSKIINKPGPLTEDEYDVIKAHPAIGARILEPYKTISPEMLQLVRHHHERMDGSGYPDGRPLSQLDEEVSIIAMVDVYDALSSDRVYRSGRLPHEALKIVFSLRGKHFPAPWVDRFIQCLGIYPPGTTVKVDTGEVGVVTAVNHGQLLRPRVCIVRDVDGSPLQRNRHIDLNSQDFIKREIVQVIDPQTIGLDPAQCFTGQPKE